MSFEFGIDDYLNNTDLNNNKGKSPGARWLSVGLKIPVIWFDSISEKYVIRKCFRDNGFTNIFIQGSL
jgi:hypothetical protein